MSLQQEITIANQIVGEMREALEATPQWKALRAQEALLKGLIRRAEEEAKAKETDAIARLVALGFEARTGHSFDGYDSDGSNLTWVICHSSRPKLDHAYDGKYENRFDFLGNQEPDTERNWVLSYGETQEKAWEGALEATQSEINEALAGV